jgi:hypothetical protein
MNFVLTSSGARASRLVLAVVLVALVTAPLLAQEDRRGFIGLDIGPSQPFGAFGSPADGAGAGNARAGYTSTLLNVGWRRGERWGVAGLLAYSEYLVRNTDGIDDDWWQVAFLTVGPMYTVPLGSKAAVDLKGTLGLAALTPVIDSRASDSDTGSGLAVDLRATLRYDVLRRWAIFAEGGMQSANASFLGRDAQVYRAWISGFGVAFRPQWGSALR